MDGKPASASKMVWWNILMLVLTIMSTLGVIAAGIPGFAVSPFVMALLGTMGAVGNIWLRFLTKQPITTIS